MEEKLLSPRVLMYTDRQLRWVCNTTRDCDGGHIDSYHNDLVVGPSRVTYVGASVNPDRLNEYIKASATPAGADEEERFATAWSILVTCYTRRTVTHVRDRLRAIGGIAEEFSRLTGYRYLAGLWRETLAYDLLWKEDNPVDVPVPEWSTWRGEAPEFFLKRAQQATAPTWSWARGHYQITTWMHGRINFSDFSIVDSNVELQSAERPYGDVLSGSLTLRGRMKQLYLLDSHKVQYLGRSIWKTGEDTYYTIGTANLDPGND
ncbi:putative heterokaryon incompatibility protein [Diplodia seriata]|uniref:Putative heterokaryon incompatibility protein n=1 Tax=Diplodia seriata TaxID=420778 RepID=A0A0G2FN90_9PEZI|nr:putative heterokaryon incompatibility protein [Diplodia seriata]